MPLQLFSAVPPARLEPEPGHAAGSPQRWRGSADTCREPRSQCRPYLWNTGLPRASPAPPDCRCARSRVGTGHSRHAAGFDPAGTAARVSRVPTRPGSESPSRPLDGSTSGGWTRLSVSQPVPLLMHANQHTQGFVPIFHLEGT